MDGKFSPLSIMQLTSGRLFVPREFASFILNMQINGDGLLESMPDPIEFLPDYWGVDYISDVARIYGPGYFEESKITIDQSYVSVFHCLLPNNRDCLLIHARDGIYEYSGAYNGWRRIYELDLTNYTNEYSTQWVLTPRGVVIIPGNSRVLFYDGETIDFFGFAEIPKPPTGRGPSSSKVADQLYPLGGGPTTITDPPVEQRFGTGTPPTTRSNVNDGGYILDGFYGFGNRMFPNMGVGRLGTITTPEGLWSSQGKLLTGEYRCKVQYVDYFGNLSPLSGPSNPVTWVEQYSWMGTYTLDGTDWVPNKGIPSDADKVKKQALWTSIPRGPTQVLGRILYRSKDLNNSGDATYYEVPGSAAPSGNVFATLPDNITTEYPDNIPDSWLVTPEQNIVPVPVFRFGAFAFGRFWLANTEAEPGLIRASLVGQFGTFTDEFDIIVDARGAAITGIYAHTLGLIVFTTNTTFFVGQNEQGTGFKLYTINSTVGCIAPNSIAMTPQEELIWLATDGFYKLGAEKRIEKISVEVDYYFEKINRGTIHKSVAVYDTTNNQYMCFVPWKYSYRPRMGFVYDGKGWRFYAPMDVYPDTFPANFKSAIFSVCETKDHRRNIIAVGASSRSGDTAVKVLNNGLNKPLPIELSTSWMHLGELGTNNTVTLYLLLRETSYSADVSSMSDHTSLSYPLTIKTYKNMDDEVAATTVAALIDFKQLNNYWAQTTIPTAATTQIFKRRKVFWVKIDLNMPQAETIKFQLTTTKWFEMLGMAFNEQPNVDPYTNLATVGVQIVSTLS